jgi:hypothetical protein
MRGMDGRASESPCPERTFEVFLTQSTSGKPKKLLITIAAAALFAVAAVTPASATAGQPEHGSNFESFTDPNFCGTGASVEGLFESTFTVSERDGVFKIEHHGSVTFTYGDASVVFSFAGQFTDTMVATGAGGVEVHQLISKGITGKIQAPNGPVLVLEAGLIIELDGQFIRVNGPHPIAASGGSLFCAVVSQALGIT